MPILPPTSTYSGGASDNNLYLRAGQPVVLPSGSTLVSQVNVKPASGAAGSTTLLVDGNAASVYGGGISINPGANAAAPAGAVGLNIHATATGVDVEVGTDGAGIVNHLSVAGSAGLGEVYDEVYNQPVALRPMTMVQTNPVIAPANAEEVLRGAQAAVAAAIATPGSVFNIFSVPRSGAYMVQTEIAMGNATPVNTVVIPSTLVGGVPIWKSISLGFQVQGTVNPVPYASFEIIGGDFYGDQAFAANSLITKTFTSLAILQAGVNYAVILNAETGWNIGDAGQIKTELIAMC